MQQGSRKILLLGVTVKAILKNRLKPLYSLIKQRSVTVVPTLSYKRYFNRKKEDLYSLYIESLGTGVTTFPVTPAIKGLAPVTRWAISP